MAIEQWYRRTCPFHSLATPSAMASSLAYPFPLVAAVVAWACLLISHQVGLVGNLQLVERAIVLVVKGLHRRHPSNLACHQLEVVALKLPAVILGLMCLPVSRRDPLLERQQVELPAQP